MPQAGQLMAGYELSTLRAVARAIASPLDVELVLKRTIQAALFLTHAKVGFVLLVDEKTGNLTLRAGKRPTDQAACSMNIDVSDAVARRVITTGHSVHIHSFREEQGHKVKTGYRLKSFLYIPMKWSGQVIGVLVLGQTRHTARNFSTDDVALLTLLTTYTAAAIYNQHPCPSVSSSVSSKVDDLRLPKGVAGEASASARRAGLIVVSAYAVAIAGAEGMGVLGNVLLGIVCNAILLLVMLSHYAIVEESAPYRRILPALALMPLLRILSLTMPIREIPQLFWYAMVGVPLLSAVVLTRRLLDLNWASFGLRRSSWLPQVAIALSGLPLGLGAFLLLRPQPIVAQVNWLAMGLAALLLAIFTGFSEEIIFRGLLQHLAQQVFGSLGVFFSSALFAIMYMGSLSLRYVFFVGLVGLFWGWCVNRTGSIWGAALAHSLLSIGMLLAWPMLFQNNLVMQVL